MFSPAAEAQIGPFGNPDTTMSAQVGLSLRKNAVLEEAQTIADALINGKKAIHVARDAQDVMAYGIGCMMAKMASGKVIEDLRQAFYVLHQAFPFSTVEGEKGLRMNRRTVIATLKENGIVSEKASIKDIKPAGSLPTIQEIGAIVESVMKVSLTQIQSKKRSRSMIDGRFCAIWVMRFACGHSLNHIGKQIGGRDHSSILNGIGQLDLARQQIPKKREEVDNILDAADLMAIKRSHKMRIDQLGTSNLRRVH